MRRLIVTVGLVALVSLGAPSDSNAGLIIDQSQVSFDGFINLRFTGVTGQTFTPALSTLDIVELLFDGPGGTFPPNIEGNFSVGIHQGTIFGPLVGTSAPLSLLTGIFQEVVRFEFPVSVPLVPGNLYAMELNRLSDPDSPFFLGLSSGAFGGPPTRPDLYLGGGAIVAGSPVLNADFFFREGPNQAEVVPEPGTLELCGLAVMILCGVYASRKRTVDLG
jgi:hypothetical protein